ncbi:MAG: hypothetical protein U9N59_02990 [Campylobacterota bacterium]|nr:hypothetical protein [Campylobacterota bacterium]
MYNKNLIIKLFFTFIILCLIYLLDFLRSFFSVLFFLYMPDTRVGIIVTFLIVYIVYFLKRKNTTNTLNNTNKSYHIIFAVSIALFINGMLQLLSQNGLIYMFDIPFLINKYEFVILSLIITFMIAFLYMIFIFYSKVKHSLSVLIVNALFGVFSLFLTTAISLKEVNMFFDTTKPHINETVVVDKRMENALSKTGFKLYYITYAGYKEQEVTSSTYRKMDISDKVNVYVKDGFLNAKWVAKIEKT